MYTALYPHRWPPAPPTHQWTSTGRDSSTNWRSTRAHPAPWTSKDAWKSCTNWTQSPKPKPQPPFTRFIPNIDLTELLVRSNPNASRYPTLREKELHLCYFYLAFWSCSVPVVVHPKKVQIGPKCSKKSLTNVIVKHCSGIRERNFSTIYSIWLYLTLLHSTVAPLLLQVNKTTVNWNYGVPTKKKEKISIYYIYIFSREYETKQQVEARVSVCVAWNSVVIQVSRHASDLTRSIGGICCFMVCPAAERDPLMNWMEEQRSAKVRVHLSQEMVLLWDW